MELLITTLVTAADRWLPCRRCILLEPCWAAGGGSRLCFVALGSLQEMMARMEAHPDGGLTGQASLGRGDRLRALAPAFVPPNPCLGVCALTSCLDPPHSPLSGHGDQLHARPGAGGLNRVAVAIGPAHASAARLGGRPWRCRQNRCQRGSCHAPEPTASSPPPMALPPEDGTELMPWQECTPRSHHTSIRKP